MFKEMKRELLKKFEKVKEKESKREKIRPLIEKNLRSSNSKTRKSSANILLRKGFRFKSAGRKRRPGTRA